GGSRPPGGGALSPGGGGAGRRGGKRRSVCEPCRFLGEVRPRGVSRFLLCRLSQTAARFAKYPPQPVLRCGGYQPKGDTPATRPPGCRPLSGGAPGPAAPRAPPHPVFFWVTGGKPFQTDHVPPPRAQARPPPPPPHRAPP